MGGEGQLFVGDSIVVGFYFGFDVEQFLAFEGELFQKGFQRMIGCVRCDPYTPIFLNVGVILLINHHMTLLRPMIRAPPEGVFPILDKMNLPADAAPVGFIVEE